MVRMRFICNLFDVITVVVKLNRVIVDDDKPVAEQALCDLINEEWFYT